MQERDELRVLKREIMMSRKRKVKKKICVWKRKKREKEKKKKKKERGMATKISKG
jgi:hypothetical protein